MSVFYTCYIFTINSLYFTLPVAHFLNQGGAHYQPNNRSYFIFFLRRKSNETLVVNYYCVVN